MNFSSLKPDTENNANFDAVQANAATLNMKHANSIL